MPETKDLWKAGKLLADAPIHFAPRSLIRELKNSGLRSGKEWASVWGMYADGHGDIDPEARQKVTDGLNEIQGAIANWSARTSYILKCRAALLKSLSKERLLAYGVSKGSKNPSLIPAFLFEYPKYAVWEDSRVVGNELEFHSVRITRLSVAINARKFRSSKIIEIIKGFSKDSAFPTIRKIQADIVRSEIIKKYPKIFPDGRYADIKTISRYLREFLPSN